MKFRPVILALGMLILPLTSSADVSVDVSTPNVSIGINLPAYPQLVRVPNYPVYYAPRLEANYFFYDGLYWVFQGDDWYVSSWYNGPWDRVNREDVPVYILRIPVRYYRRPPQQFHGWQRNAPPHWGEQWGHDWEQRRGDWDKGDRRAEPKPAPLPTYQRQYSGKRYPQQVDKQYELQQKKYRYQPRDPVVQKHYQERGKGRDKGQGHDKERDRRD